MGNLFDLIIAVVFVATVVLCYRRGFIRMLCGFRKYLAFVLAWALKDAPFINEVVGKIFRTGAFKSFINDKAEQFFADNLRAAAQNGSVSPAQRFDNVFGFFGDIFSGLKDFCLSLYDKDFVKNGTVGEQAPSEKVEAFVKEAVNYVGDSAASFITAIMSFILLYVLFRILFRLGAGILDEIFSDGLLGILNHGIGGIVGVMYAFVVCWIISIVFVVILPLITSLSIDTVVGGFFDITEWFYSKFFMSQVIGLSV